MSLRIHPVKPSLQLVSARRFGSASPIPRSQIVQYADLGTPKPDETERLKTELATVRKLEGRLTREGIPEAFYPDSLTNRIYQALYPRENGVIIYAGALQDQSFQDNQHAAEKLGAMLAKSGKHIITAGGPGYMQKVAEGAATVGGHTIACNVKRIPDTDPNLYKEIYYHDEITSRMNGDGGYESRGSYTIALPGGFGTFHELFQKANELWYGFSPYKTQKAIILLDLDGFYQTQFLPFLDSSIKAGKTKPGVRELFRLAKTPEAALDIINDTSIPFSDGVKKKLNVTA